MDTNGTCPIHFYYFILAIVFEFKLRPPAKFQLAKLYQCLRLFVLQQQNTAARAGFHHAYSFIIRCHAMQ